MKIVTSHLWMRLKFLTLRFLIVLAVIPIVMGGVIPILEYSDGQFAFTSGIKTAEAATATLRPQSNTTNGGDTTNITNAYDTDTTTQSATTYGGNVNPELTLFNWGAISGGSDSLTLEVEYEATAG